MIKKDDNFSEKIMLALTDIDDSFIQEAAPVENMDDSFVQESKSVERQDGTVQISGADMIRTHKHAKKILLLAACFILIVTAVVPFIGSMEKTKGSDGIKDLNDDNAFGASYGTVEEGRLDAADTESDNDKALGGCMLTTNRYKGHELDDIAKDPQGVLSQMATSTAPEGFHISNPNDTATVYAEGKVVKSVYIVAISNSTVGEIIRVYDASTLELLLEAPGNDVEDILLELGMAG